ncbi:unnamed protein product [Phytomonas sp. EM1]|nr:unnamed protein product [Phytomonas sp. EM1]|eukprot:CCW65144.1 unnamed protein product [Phytomonas sp. isolate EM1]
MEPQWTACQCVIPLFRVSPAVGGGNGPPNPNDTADEDAEEARPTRGSKEIDEIAPGRIPCAIDYARNLLVTGGQEGGKGFFLLHFATSPQLEAPETRRGGIVLDVSSDLPGGGGGVRGAMPTAIRVKRVAASPPAAHRNPLDQLALFVGRAPHGSAAGGIASLPPSALALSLAAAGEGVWVAASSICATRITLWALTPIPGNGLSPSPWSNLTEGGDGAFSFTAIRVFRVGFRMAMPPFARWGGGGRQTRPHEGGARMFSTTPTFNPRGGGKEAERGGDDRAHDAAPRGDARQIHHLQFLHQGRFLFCVWNGSMLVFSTTKEDPSEKVPGADPPQAAVNHRSIFTNAVKRVVPGGLRFFHDYTRQEWFSCREPLPLRDPVFYPQWLWMYKQDILAGGDTKRHPARGGPQRLVEGGKRVGDATSGADREERKGSSYAYLASSSRLEKWVSQLTHATGGYGAKTHPMRNPERSEPLDWVSDALYIRMTSQGSPCNESGKMGSEKSRKGISTPPTNAVPSGSPPYDSSFTHIEPCIFVWEHDLSRATAHSHQYGPANAPLSMQSHSQSTSPSLGSMHFVKNQPNPSNTAIISRKVVLDCVTCDGAFLNIRLYTREGTLQCSPALPCTLE